MYTDLFLHYTPPQSSVTQGDPFRTHCIHHVTHSVPTTSRDECSVYGMGHAWDTEDAFPHTFLFYSCISELGMKSGAIPDTAITGSASQQGYGPEHARIDNPQGWYTPERQSSGDWLQIDTGSVHYITKIATQVDISILI